MNAERISPADLLAALTADEQFRQSADGAYRSVFRGTSAARVPSDWSMRLAKSIVDVSEEQRRKRSGIVLSWDRTLHEDYDEEVAEAELTYMGLLLCRYIPVLNRCRARAYTFGLDGFQELADAHLEWLESLPADEIMTWNYEEIRESLRFQGVLVYPFDCWLRMIVYRGEEWLWERQIPHFDHWRDSIEKNKAGQAA